MTDNAALARDAQVLTHAVFVYLADIDKTTAVRSEGIGATHEAIELRHGERARIPLNEMVKIDYLYGANWSLWLDIKILLRTVPFVVGQRGL